MEIRLIAVARRSPPWVHDACGEYLKRLSAAVKITVHEIAPSAKRNEAREARSIGKLVTASYAVALDERGHAWSSEDLAMKFANWRQQGEALSFVIGGADGHAAGVLAQVRETWSLSPLTLPHQLVRVIVLEQLYRAWTLLEHHPYHRV